MEKPFEGKKKSEFPDAFMLSAIDNYASDNKHEEIYIISTDSGITDYQPKNNNINIINDLAVFIHEILTSKDNYDINYYESIVCDNYHLVEDEVISNLNDTIGYKLFEFIQFHDPWKDNVDYDDLRIDEVKILEFLITDINRDSILADYLVELTTNITMSFNDLTTGLYDKESDSWYFTDYKSGDYSYKIKAKISIDFFYEKDGDDVYVEINNSELIKIIEFKEITRDNKPYHSSKYK